MSLSPQNCATMILGIPYTVGVVLILISQWEAIPDRPTPWDDISIAFGATLRATALGLGAAHINQAARRYIPFVLVALLGILVMIVVVEGWKPELITFLSVVWGVVMAEGLSWLLRRFC